MSKISMICLRCAKPYVIPRSHWARGTAKYCSIACAKQNLTLEEIGIRFWVRVNKAGRTVPHVDGIDPCWEWTGITNEKGYGVASYQKRNQLAHRMAWLLTYGALPNGYLLHKCDNSGCVNPEHLRPGTLAENNRDMVLKGRTCRGSARADAKIVEADVIAIRARAATGEKPHVIGLSYNMSQANIRRIVARKMWKHVA